MKIKGNKHVYTVLPNLHDNRLLPVGERIEIDLQGVSQPEMDALERKKAAISSDHVRDEAMRLIVAETVDLVRGKFKGIRGLEIEGLGPITDFDTFYEQAPKELVDWVTTAIFNTYLLAQADAKNFEPPPGSACGNRSAAPFDSAAAIVTSEPGSNATAATGGE